MPSNLTDFGFGGRATASIVNAFSSGGVVSSASLVASSANNSKEVLSGALTANTLKTLLTISGSGRIDYLAVYAKDATSRTVRLRLTVDGVTSPYAFDATSGTCTNTGLGMQIAGAQTSTSYPTQSGAFISFNTSLVVDVASSLAETDKVAIAYNATLLR